MENLTAPQGFGELMIGLKVQNPGELRPAVAPCTADLEPLNY